MPVLKNLLYKSILVLTLSLFFVSCSSMNHFKTPAETPAGNNKDKTSDIPDHSGQIKISMLESELENIRKSQINLNLQMETKDAAIQELQYKVLKLEKKISILEKNKIITKSAVKPVSKKKVLRDPSVLYKKSRNLFLESNFINAADLFTEFIKDYPENNLADNAVYWLAECHYSLGDYKKAITIFKDLITRHPKSDKVPDAMLKIGYSYLSLNDSNRAHHYLKKVLTNYPFSQASEKAEKKLGSFE